MAGKSLPELLRLVNERICELHTEASGADAGFLCECGQRACKEQVRLTPKEYAGRDAVSILACGHKRTQTKASLPLKVLVSPFGIDRTAPTLRNGG